MTLKEFSQKVIMEGVDNRLGPILAPVLGIPPDAQSRAFEMKEGDCSDGKYRTFDVIVESSGTERLPHMFVLLVMKKHGLSTEDYWFTLHPNGRIEKALRSMGKLTETGHGVPGSSVDVDLDPDEAQRLLKRELDFWLKGIGLKKKPAAKKAKS
jgi:hypothetical protein